MADGLNALDPPRIARADIRPGDVLLSLGTGELSKLLAWNGDSHYSHGALAVDSNDVVEAATSGVRRIAIAAPKRQAEIVFTDVYRPIDGKRVERKAEELAGVVTTGLGYVGSPYAIDFLKQLALIISVRQHIPEHPIGRWVVRIALDHLARDQQGHYTCTEIVYRAFDGAPSKPPHALRPVVKIQPYVKTPMPPVDWIALWHEVQPLLRPAPHAKAGASAPAGSVTGSHAQASSAPKSPALPAALGSGALPPDAHPAISDAEMHAALAAARAQHGLATVPAADRPLAKAAMADIVPNPNPQTVVPGDFETSPSYRLVGRLIA